ncbi:NADH:ubiquinone oxidoreductase [Wolbachia endosymbiont of Cruorifilaria tuberocauda]|uniref:NADH-ubiquinone oxidoreductase subunit NDUFA12 family protein n=1 Tax=Wolbachia endosymbiont of Cruorifilaria tuberocauda TaxID=1812111 RepID=UPI001588A27B|nr:NADH-ubiquinone oxidoreductase subunit NDUFA12 family protein [Wolbachia endosymbiont of Cruorifilaria tuberocauda]QKX01927.1 NADH:ubiquinone oxidoreductase [Wolbachia endosymbiont of Cruorifilaria tuberocauda]
MLSKICNAVKSLLRREDQFVGRDKNENFYYKSSTGKRWVIYKNTPDPTTIPPEWHIWVHYTDNTVPVNEKKTKVKHITNFTGTKVMCNSKQEVKSYYRSWNPNNK